MSCKNCDYSPFSCSSNPLCYYNCYLRNETREPESAIAYIKGSSTYPNISGIVMFVNYKNGVAVYVNVEGLPTYKPAQGNSSPIGPHGFHIHDMGVCEESEEGAFMSSGGHFNPSDQPHGNHSGDFPVLFSNHGKSIITFYTDKFKVEDIVGKSVIIHENPDDYRTQPAGNSGKRIACGVIQKYR